MARTTAAMPPLNVASTGVVAVIVGLTMCRIAVLRAVSSVTLISFLVSASR